MVWDSTKPIGTDLLANSHAQIVANWGALQLGWLDAAETWTWASATTINVPTDATTKYSVGMKIKITQATGGTKYFEITIVAATLLTLYNPLGSVVNNEAINSPCFSSASQPFGYPAAKAYGQAYRSAVYNFGDANRWEEIAFSGGTNNLVNIAIGNFNPTYGDTTNNKLTVILAGVYRITYSVSFKGNNGADYRVTATRLKINNTTEVLGSALQRSVSPTVYFPTTHDRVVIVSLSASDYISLQAGVNVAGQATIEAYSYGSPAMTTSISAIITIERIG